MTASYTLVGGALDVVVALETTRGKGLIALFGCRVFEQEIRSDYGDYVDYERFTDLCSEPHVAGFFSLNHQHYQLSHVPLYGLSLSFQVCQPVMLHP